MEIAVVGPDTRCQLEPNSAAIIAGTMAAYRPYSGGMPAMVAKATPCGSTIIAPVMAAIKSALWVSRLTMGHQRRNGRILKRWGWLMALLTTLTFVTFNGKKINWNSVRSS